MSGNGMKRGCLSAHNICMCMKLIQYWAQNCMNMKMKGMCYYICNNAAARVF